MSSLAPDIRLRPETPSDEAFLLRLFASTRAAELALLAGPAGAGGALTPAQEAFVRVQAMAQSRSYQMAYPAAERAIVLLDGAPAGRRIVDREGEHIVLVDVALLPEHRGKGAGTALLTPLLAEAARSRRKVRLHVVHTNPAVRLYRRLGFVRTGGDEIRDAMEWAPEEG